MAAPTPVSSLVHSSTLVTAGVYLIIRFFIYFSGGEFSNIFLFISVLTMFYSGLRAIFELDFKKIIAFSTLSQLGIIIIILSLGNYSLSFFHLVVHAFYKALLFLIAGIRIHNIIGVQDIRKLGVLGGLRPFICGLIVLSSLSLIGFPFLRGFYSKDLILERVYYLNINLIIL